MSKVDGQQEFDLGLHIGDEQFKRIVPESGGGDWTLEPLAKEVAPQNTPEDEDEPRTSPWEDIGGGKPFVKPTLEQEQVIVAAHMGSRKMEADVQRAKDSLDNGIKYGLSGEIVRTYKQQEAISALGKLARETSDARAVAKGDKPEEVAARRKAKDERRLREY